MRAAPACQVGRVRIRSAFRKSINTDVVNHERSSSRLLSVSLFSASTGKSFREKLRKQNKNK